MELLLLNVEGALIKGALYILESPVLLITLAYVADILIDVTVLVWLRRWWLRRGSA